MSKYWPLIKVLPIKTNFRFVAFSRLAAIVSAVAVVVSLGFTLFPFEPPCAGLSCGIDFKGGTLLEISTAPKAVDLGLARATLEAQNLGDVQVQAFGEPTTAMIRFQTPDGLQPAVAVDKVKTALVEALGPVTFQRADVVGPKVSGELFLNSLISLGLAMLLVMAYIWLRFDFQFGVGAVLSLFHDAILTLGVFSFFRIEFTLPVIAALLTVIGYSMNDTVVVFDRMRENFRKYKQMPPGEVIDLSINETLSRTLMTIGTVLIASLALYVWGGETMRAFAICMLFGTVVATYSSIYIAAPALPMFGDRPGRPTKPKSGLMARGAASE